MREAKFILPLAAGPAAMEYTRQALLNGFGGYTVVPTDGAWQAPYGEIVDEPGYMFVVAMHADDYGKFQRIALEAGRMGRQQAVYIVSPTGEAEIVVVEPGKPDRIVRPDPEAALTPHQRSIMHGSKNEGENLPVQQGDLWLTADDSLVRITNRKMSGQAYGQIIESTDSYSVGASVVYSAHDGRVDTPSWSDPHPLHLKKLLHRV